MFKVGDKIRSYDFFSSKDYYFEGEIYQVNEYEGLYYLNTSKIVRDGKEAPIENGDEQFRTPITQHGPFEYEGRLTKIED